jgi:hypothetical protein
VSLRRRRAAVAVVICLCSIVGAWNYFLSSGYLTPLLREKIEMLTGAKVELDSARFRLFKGLDLEGLSIQPPDGGEAILSAEAVHLEYRLWNLISNRAFGIERIVCHKPRVTLEYFQGPDGEETTNLQQLFSSFGSDEKSPLASLPLESLPMIEFHKGRIRRVDRTATKADVMEKPFHCVMLPVRQGEYRGIVELTAQRAPIWLRYACELDTGRLRLLGGSVSSEALDFLPPRFHTLVKRYKLRGEFLPVYREDAPKDADAFEVQLHNFSLELPPEDGGLTMRNIRGHVALEGSALRIDLAGRLVEFGNAELSARGHLSSLTNPAFDLDLALRGVKMPIQLDPNSPMAALLAKVETDFRIRGTGDVVAYLGRARGGNVRCRGYIAPQGVSGLYREFPLALKDVRGRIEFDETGIRGIDLTAKRGEGTLRAIGRLQDVRHLDHWRTLFDVKVTGENIALEPALLQALPPEGKQAWAGVQPSGRSDVGVHLSRRETSKKLALSVELRPRGELSLRCKEFPYPLHNCVGRVTVAKDIVTVHDIHSHHGKLQISASGTLEHLSAKTPTIRLQIQGSHMPYDKTLTDILPPDLQGFLTDLNYRGTIHPIAATITQSPGKALHYDVRLGLPNGALRYKPFPYALEEVNGTLHVLPEIIRIESLRARHGKQVVTAGGYYAPKKAGRDDFKILVGAEDAELTGDFLAAAQANPALAKAIKPFQYVGKADLLVEFTPSKNQDEVVGYAARLMPKGGQLLWDQLPYRMDTLTGEVLVQPERITLRDLKATHGKATLAVGGKVDLSALRTQATLAVKSSTPVDEDLLKVMTFLESPFDGNLQAGGTITTDLTQLQLTWDHATKTEPAKFAWTTDGRIGLADAQYKIDLADKEAHKLTGELLGHLGRRNDLFTAHADAALTTFQVEHIPLKEIRGELRCTERDRNVLQIQKLTARCQTGKLAGNVSVHLDGETEYEFDLSMVDVPLAATLTTEASRKLMKGSLQGRLAMHYKTGKKRIRQAEGHLEIVRGELYRLPVYLDTLSVLALQLPGKSAFQSGHIRYTLRDDTLNLREIFLTGKSISLLGSGTISLKTDALELSFLTGPPGKLPRIDQVSTEILRALSKQLMEIRVTGTTAKPKFQPRPLGRITTILETLLAPLKAR